jgi:hypothetical protein
VTGRRPLVDQLDRPGVLLGLCLAAYLPFTLLGYGTDIDVGNVLQSGRDWLDDGVYRVSRTPGAAVHEVGTAALDRMGSYVLVNVASLCFGLLALWSVHRLLRRAGSPIAGPAAVVLATNPWFWVASTSLGDFIWSAGLLLAGTVVAGAERRGPSSPMLARAAAGVLFGLATGSRSSAGALVLAWLLAERLGRPSGRPSWRATLVTVGAATATAALCFVPSWLWADRTFDFLDSGLAFEGLGSHVGRWGVKNLAFFGIAAVPVLLAGIPRLLRARGAWSSSVAFRFAVLAAVATELLFLRYPLKPLHLLPAGVALALLVGHLGVGARRWTAALVAVQLVGGLVTATVAAPDVEDRARSGRIEVGLTDGPLLNDARCRLEDLDDGAYDDGRSPESTARAKANFDCQLSTWRASG